MKMNKTTAVVLAVLLTLVIAGTFAALLSGWFNPVIRVTSVLLGFLLFGDLAVLCDLLGGSYDAK